MSSPRGIKTLISAESDSDLFSFLSAMHLNAGTPLMTSPHYNSTSTSRKRKILEAPSGKNRLKTEYSSPTEAPDLVQSGEEGSSKIIPGEDSLFLSDIDDNLAANFDDSLSGLGVVDSQYNMSEALLALPNLSISSSQAHVFKTKSNHTDDEGAENPEFITPILYPVSSNSIDKKTSPSSEPPVHKFEYMLMAASSIATKKDETSITYLNQGNSYELRLKKLGDLSGYRNILFKSVIRICFHERRLQYSESEQIAEWSSTHPGERILDLDVANSYGLTDPIKDPKQLNFLSFTWDPLREAGISIKVNCVSTEFTPKKHGGEKGVPFRLQVETYESEENGGARLHAAGCVLQIFKLKGADRKHKQDKEKISKKPLAEQELFSKPCKTTVLTDLPTDTIYLPSSRSDTPVPKVESPIVEPGEEPTNVVLPITSEPTEIVVRSNSNVSLSDTPEEVGVWLIRKRFGSFVKTFKNYDGRDVLSLTKEELVSLVGAVEGIRLYNGLHSATIPPKTTFYVSIKESSEYRALFLEEYSLKDLIHKFAESVQILPELFSKAFLIGPKGILIRIDDKVVKFMKPESIFKFSLASAAEGEGAFDVIFEEVSVSLENPIKGLANITVYNKGQFRKALNDRPKGTPLVTVSNHHSCLDDLLLCGIMDVQQITTQSMMRWVMSAHNICFTKWIHSKFFAFGKSIPVMRGGGVYQNGVNFALERMTFGDWIHFYPEGKVNMTPKENIRLKWGIGRVIADAETTPIILPYYHIGMEQMLPNYKPYIPRPFKKITVIFGDPIDIKDLLKSLRDSGASQEEVRKTLTDLIQSKLRQLRVDAEILHTKHMFKP